VISVRDDYLDQFLGCELATESEYLLVDPIIASVARIDVSSPARTQASLGILAAEGVHGLDAGNPVGQRVGEGSMIKVADILAAHQCERVDRAALPYKFNGGDLRSGGRSKGVVEVAGSRARASAGRGDRGHVECRGQRIVGCKRCFREGADQIGLDAVIRPVIKLTPFSHTDASNSLC